MKIVSAEDGAAASATSCSTPPMARPAIASRASRAGRAKSSAARRRPMYQWPRPGHRNDRTATTEVERDGATLAVRWMGFKAAEV